MRIVLVTGGFDPLHSGHIRYFTEAKKLGDRLIVGVNSDAWLTRKKGRPFMPLEERAEVIRALSVVDAVVAFHDDYDADGSCRKFIEDSCYNYEEDEVGEKSREYTFYALLQGIYHIATSDSFSDYEEYFSIPNNDKLFLDVIHRYENKKDVGYLYKDEILENRLVSHLVEESDYDISNKIGHLEIVFETK